MRRVMVIVVAVGAVLAASLAALRIGAHRGAGRRVEGGILMSDVAAYERLSAILLGTLFRGIAADVAANAPPGGRVLEVGSGPGHLARRLASVHGLSVTAVDLDPAMVQRARANARRAIDANGSRPVFAVANAAALPFDRDSFDLVVSTFSLHHWADPEAGLTEIARVLRPGGKALIWDLRHGRTPFHVPPPGDAGALESTPLGVPVRRPWRWPFGVALAERLEFDAPSA